MKAFIATIALLLIRTAFAADDLVAAQECRPRSGLSNFLARAATPGAEVKIAYLGGSITAQPGWRPKTLAHFRKTWPGATFSEINAAIGGTGSDLGVFRLRQDVLDHRPDLLFVEFAVNDGGAPHEQIHRCMEGIVRQTWRTLPACDICFVYTLTEALAPAMLDGKFPRSASAMEQIADHYAIPTIHMGMEVANLAKDGRLAWKAPLPKTEDEKRALGNKVVFAPDGVHPHVETGHELYAAAVVRSLAPIRASSKARAPHTLGAPFIATNYERAAMVPVTAATLSSGFQPAPADFAGRWSHRLSALHKASTPGDTLTFRFKGTRAAIYDIVGPDCGQVRVTVDDQPARLIPRIDAYCTYHRLATLSLGTELPDAVHTVRIEISPEVPDKAMILARNGNRIDDPARLEGTAFYPGAILLVGEIVK